MLRYLAKTACETFRRARRFAISSAESSFGGRGSVVVRRSLRVPFACSMAASSPVLRLLCIETGRAVGGDVEKSTPGQVD